jgi:hypothetical protein
LVLLDRCFAPPPEQERIVFTFKKAEELAKTWVRLATDDSCEISQVDDKPYGWVFHYQSKNYDPDDFYTHTLGNSPIIVDRIDGEITGTGTAHPLEHYIKNYEESLPESRLLMTPERHDGVKKYK